jgi:hypothetical protein
MVAPTNTPNLIIHFLEVQTFLKQAIKLKDLPSPTIKRFLLASSKFLKEFQLSRRSWQMVQPL